MLVGVDMGGTFTDFVAAADASGVRTHKIPSPRGDPASVVLSGMRILHGTAMAHGTTLATNAVLEGKAARSGLVTTAGFLDLGAYR